MKWHPHGTCEETETNVSHDDLSGLLLASKYDQINACEAVEIIHASPSNLIHLENGHERRTPLLIHTRLCRYTVLLI